MKAAVIAGKGRVELRETTPPDICPGDLLVTMRACGICGTDLVKVRGEHITPPVLGHEVAGVIERTGSSIEGFRVGDRVAVHHHISCQHCYYCKNGFETLCEEYPKFNLDPSGFATTFRVPAPLVKGGTVHSLPDSMSFEEGSQAEPVACCIRALAKLGVKAGFTAAVYGVGPVGLLHVQLLKCFGATRVYAVDVVDKRLDFARKLGADFTMDAAKEDVGKAIPSQNDGLGVDLAVVATANVKALESSFDTVRKGGVVLLFGAPVRGSTLTLDMSKMFLRETRLQSSYSTSETEMRLALDLIASKRINIFAMITDRLQLSNLVEAFERAGRGTESVKVIVENQ